MSDTEEDAESKTEEPSEKKILDTLEKGHNPVSRDSIALSGFIAFLLCVCFLLDGVAERLFGVMAMMLGNAASLSLRNGADAFEYLAFVLKEMACFLAPLLSVFMIGGLAAAFAQNAPAVVFDRVMPDLSRINPAKGLGRIFGVAGLAELLKSTLKISIIFGALALSTASDSASLRDLMRTEPALAPGIAITLVIHLTSAVCITGAVLAIGDLAWVRFKWRKDIRMSRQELKDEHKQSEGDPLVKGRMRSLALTRARKRMMAAVPKATLIIANPTHYAIALRYQREDGGAPLVVAKGQDLLALKIREIGEERAIPVLEKKELVRAMYNHVEVNKMIPAEFFRPVAEIIHFLNSHGSRSRRA